MHPDNNLRARKTLEFCEFTKLKEILFKSVRNSGDYLFSNLVYGKLGRF